MRFSLLFCILAGWTTATFAQSVSVGAIKGAVEAKAADGQFSALKIGSTIADGQTIRTGKDALAVLIFPDESRVKLKDQTELVVRVPKEDDKYGIELIKGALFALAKKRPNQKFYVKTPVGVAGVRGTQFFTSYDKNLWMCVQEGEVEIKGDGEPVNVAAGFGVVVEKGKKIAPPKQYAWTKKLNWNMDSEKGDLTDKTTIDDYNPLKKHYD